MTTTYAVTAERSGRFWALEIPEVEGYTQVRSLTDAEPMARDCISFLTNVPPNSFDITVTVKLPTTVQQHLKDSHTLAEQAATAQAQAAAESRAAIRELHQQGLSLKEIGLALGISRQRAHQLVH
ncbi:MAG: hypothetical protein B5766_00660 [Candidatus Lumbricidophila eiseniae]|uniref:HicB-like antitoxin of toxin-antitoxin system domain-containing protein n=1 Tax=Candidatus Lumbricidiphila eiseniae TaxID=1969409 RepID=A0A2A6FUU1_9MICO|nr:MAG: hypothetical protein B5766_00660 [Candidatus Lumbricidophila eiseniae]